MVILELLPHYPNLFCFESFLDNDMPKVAWHSAFLTTFFAVFFRVPKKAWHGHRVLGAISRFGENYSGEQIIEGSFCDVKFTFGSL